MTKTRLDRVTNLVLMGCCIVVTGLLVRKELAPRQSDTLPPPPTHVGDWASLAAGRERIGASSAPIVLIEFSDFQCPYCKAFSKVIDTLKTKYGASLQVVFRNFPLVRIHPLAHTAAIAAECAAIQGRFSQYHDRLFRTPDSLAAVDWIALAADEGVADTIEFAKCVREAQPESALRLDSIAAERIALVGTPTVIINGWRFARPPSVLEADQVIARVLKDAASK